MDDFIAEDALNPTDLSACSPGSVQEVSRTYVPDSAHRELQRFREELLPSRSTVAQFRPNMQREPRKPGNGGKLYDTYNTQITSILMLLLTSVTVLMVPLCQSPARSSLRGILHGSQLGRIRHG
ncbi:hypothetical protein MTO96_039847 [Rhipicephalus appendiculatus]